MSKTNKQWLEIIGNWNRIDYLVGTYPVNNNEKEYTQKKSILYNKDLVSEEEIFEIVRMGAYDPRIVIMTSEQADILLGVSSIEVATTCCKNCSSCLECGSKYICVETDEEITNINETGSCYKGEKNEINNN